MIKKPLIIISGATAVGKTDLSISLAKAINGEIISADSMQVYKGFDIGTAKITPSEMQGIKHYLIDELEANEEFNVYEFKKRAVTYIDEIIARKKIPIIVGGTGFYIQSVLYDIDFTEEESDVSYRNELERIARTDGNDVLFEMLIKVDPEYAAIIHANNTKRVIRGLTFYHETGMKMSEHNKEQQAKISSYNSTYFVLNRSRDVIYDRINTRVDLMIENGLVEEVKGLLEKGIAPDSLAMQGLGYKEILEFLQGRISLKEASDILKQSTRHFAKRQLTWFKREKDTIWLNYEDYDNKQQILDKMLEIIKEKKIV